MIYLDVTSAASSPVNMGVHRTVRGVHRHLAARYGRKVVPLRWDFIRERFSTLSSRERGYLERPFAGYEGPRSIPGAGVWSEWCDTWTRKHRGLDLGTISRSEDVLFVPDLAWDSRIFAWKRFSSLPLKKLAIFHDAMPLNIPGQSGSNDDMFKKYVEELGHMDQVICISNEVRDDLRRYWAEFQIRPKPTPVLPWPVPFVGQRPVSPPNQQSKKLIYVARLKLRKNHLVLLQACESLWARGVAFSLDLIGVADAFLDTMTIVKRVEELARKGHPVQWRKHISDTDLEKAYRDCAFTVFPSRMEGFGLPIIESLWHGRPVVCGRNGAIGDVAAEGGGCLQVDQNDPVELARAIEQLLHDEVLYQRLFDEAQRRTFRSWDDYGSDLRAVLEA